MYFSPLLNWPCLARYIPNPITKNTNKIIVQIGNKAGMHAINIAYIKVNDKNKKNNAWKRNKWI